MARLTAAWAGLAVLLVHAPAALAQPGRLGGGGSLNLSLTRIVMALLLCLMLAALAALALKRGGGRIALPLPRLRGLVAALPAQRRVEVLETRRVSQYADVCLLRCDGREYLVLCAQQQQLLLRESECAVSAPASASVEPAGAEGETG
ncbi:hypothetical protein ACQKOH_08520 [Sphingomonas sp. NPDC092331]|jgi:hypothetical protein|uniref:hypothetical protein n=1 Tax=unclassified Sphingomonas TaxID=196159 RepID=UPI0029E90213|nr:hypothetical protein [Pseudomonadota bacterium]